MTFTVTPQPFNIPPRVRIDINSDDSSKPFTSLQVRRDGKLIREQPFAGGSTAVAYDYEAPFGVAVSYSVTATVATLTPIYTETWASLSGWSGGGSVSGSHYASGSANRPFDFPASGRVVCQGLKLGTSGSRSASLGIGPLNITHAQPAGLSSLQQVLSFNGQPNYSVTGLSQPFSVTWNPESAVLESMSGSYLAAKGSSGVAGLYVAASGTNSFVEDFEISTVADSPFTATATAYLDVPDAWLIHPSKPALSIPVEMGATGTGVRFIEASSGESKTSQAVSTIHRPVGRARAVVITSGPRQADEWMLVIGAETIAAKNSVRAIVDDQTPLLLRSAPEMNLDLPDDWYSVGDFTVSRVEVPVITQWTTMSLPLTPVDEPIVRQGALWTWGNVLTKYATWADVLADNDTWLDVLAGPS